MILAIDLETIPAGIELGPGFADRARARFAERLVETEGRTSFERLTRQRIVAVGVAAVTERSARVSGKAYPDEHDLIQFAFTALGATKAPDLITANGNGFDLPVLRYRALALGFRQGPLLPVYFKRFDDTHTDLQDVLANYGASERPRLADLAELCGLPPKPLTTGSDVIELVERDAWPDLAAYVGNDAATTLAIGLRYAWFRQQLSSDNYRRYIEALARVLHQTPYDAGLSEGLGAWLAQLPAVAA